MITLLDVNVLIALVDQAHTHHQPATRFFARIQSDGWATCPLTENGALRILGRPGSHRGPDSPTAARRLLQSLLSSPGHQFWPDDVSLEDERLFPRLPGSRHLTDLYLLGLAVKHEGRFATFDSGIDPALVAGGRMAFHLIPVS